MDNKIFSRIAVWALVGLVLFTVFRQYEDAYAPPRDTISYTQPQVSAVNIFIRSLEENASIFSLGCITHVLQLTSNKGFKSCSHGGHQFKCLHNCHLFS